MATPPWMKSPIWVGSPIDVRNGETALEALITNNDQKYWKEDVGIVQVDEQRWNQAQQYEADTWMKYQLDSSSDRHNEHAILFDSYRVLPNNLGDLLEIGCGPFTQTSTIIQGRIAKSITLLDPLLEQYKQHPHCSYSKLLPTPTLLAIRGEDLDLVKQFDTIICINVLEHVQDANRVLANIRRAMKPGAIVIMGERTYDDLDVSIAYDIGHPVRIKSTVLNDFKKDMVVLFANDDYFIAKN
jgi:SAM-dependent methyltransferase